MSVTFSAATGTLENNFRWLTTEDNELNVSNANFYRIMDLLDFTNVECCGRFEGPSLRTLRQVVTVAVKTLAINPGYDAGTETIIEENASGPTMIHCGLREGYFTDRLTALKAIIDIAIQNDGFVNYG